MRGVGHLHRKPLEGASCLPWLARLLAGEVDAAAHGLSRGVPNVEELAHFAATHQLGPLLSRRTDHLVMQSTLPETLRHNWQETYVRQWLANGVLVRHLHRLNLAFTDSGRDFLLLKGPYLAKRFYGDLAQRKFEDLDLLVPARLAKACLRWLKSEFEFPNPMLFHSLLSHLTHAKSLCGEALKVDLHWALRCHPSFAINEARLWSTRQSFTLPELGDRFDVLSDEYALVLTLLEIFDDLSRLEHSAKGLVDAFLILRAVDLTMDWQDFFARRKVERLHRITLDVLTMIVELFKARDLLPALVATLEKESPTDCRGLKIVLRSASRRYALWSYRLSLYDMPRFISLPHLLFSAPIRALLL